MNVTITECPTKHVLAVKHRGPYTAVSESFARLDAIARPAGLLNETLGASWSQLMGHWLPQSGQRIAQGPAYERYVNTPQHVPVSE